MIFLDASFIIYFLQGEDKASANIIENEDLYILPSQFMEVLVFFQRKSFDLNRIRPFLEDLILVHPNISQIYLAALLYGKARKEKSKTSYSDAILAAMVIDHRARLASLDNDFRFLDLTYHGNDLWTSKE
ncbi:MAG: PIN domain-containing protein [Deltaproteobacteria bacterium]|nr:PIN domain-containing protein [Deltaproteobacteria bacterium]